MNVDDFLKKDYGYGYYYDNPHDRMKKKLFNHHKTLNCYDEPIKYDELNETEKINLIFSCMGIVFECDNKMEVVEKLCQLYDFDLIQEFNLLYEKILNK